MSTSTTTSDDASANGAADAPEDTSPSSEGSAAEASAVEERGQDGGEATGASDAASVEEVLDAVAAAAQEQHRSYVEDIRTDVVEPLREALQAAAGAHGAARAAVDTSSHDRHAVWVEVVTYRHRVVDEVWRPLRAKLGDLRIGEVCRDRREALREARASLAETVPETITRPEPDALYAADETDSWLRRLRKTGIRAGRRLRELVTHPKAVEQTVPVADLVRYHGTVRLREAQADALDAVEQRLAEWTAALERVAASWTHTLLEVERLLDAAGFHRAAGAPEKGGTVKADDESGPDVDPARLLASVRAEADALDEVLKAGAELDLTAQRDRLDEAAVQAQAELETDAAEAGSFMAATRSGDLVRKVRANRAERKARIEAWPDWHRQAVDRLALMAALCALRETVAAAQDTLVDTVTAAGITPVEDVQSSAVDALQAITDEADALLTVPEAGEERALLVALDRLAHRAAAAVEESLLQPLRSLSVRRRMSDAVDLQVHALEAVIASQPETFTVHPRPEPVAGEETAAIDPRVDEQEVRWKEIVRDTLDELLFDAWRRTLPPLAGAAETAITKAEEVEQVVQFNLGAAIEEVQDLVAARRRGEDGTAQVQNARELVLDGLRRSVDLIRSGQSSLDGVRAPFVDAVWSAVTRAWTRLHDRARSAGRAREHVLRIQALLTHRLRDFFANAERQVRRGAVQARRALQVGRRRTERLVRMGQSAVGVGDFDASAHQETVEALSSVEVVLETLPVVYRRLFSFRPVQDPNLLVAREVDLNVVQRHVDRWKRGLANAVVLTGPPGSGLTSLLNVLRKTALRDARRHTIELNERIDSETAFAVKVVRALGLQMDATAGSGLTLDAVADHLRSTPRPDRLRVCTVEHLEHAFLRTVGGTALIDRILSFLSETDTQVLWIATASSTAWQTIKAYEPAAARLVVQHELDDFDRQELEELITARHRRSGLRLSFDRPDESAYPILARRVRSSSSESQRQDLLRSDFFDRLYSLCGQNVMLALFYWFRAVHLEPDDAESGILHVRPLRPISFDYLDAFSLTHAFALKALLDHGSLTVSELADVLQTDDDASRALLESLGNALLIAPAESLDPPGGFRFTSIERGTRYRIRPLVIHPVTRFLRSRNIIH